MKKLSFSMALTVIALLMSWMLFSIIVLKVEPHMPLLAGIVGMGILGLALGMKWETIEKGLLESITTGLKPILILFIVGMMISVWMQSGTVPTLLYGGLQFIQPEWFLISALIVTIIVSSFTGSSFTTIGTIGIAMMGIGSAMGVNPALAAGAVISGACFGDKMSPLSDTTNFAPAVAKVDLFTHIRHMMKTTIPAIIVTIIFFFMMSKNLSTSVNPEDMKNAINVLKSEFNLSIWTLIPPVIVLILAVRRVPVLLTLFAGLLAGIVVAILTQSVYSATSVLSTMQNGFVSETSSDLVNGIINRGGLQSMMWSVSLIVLALALGGVLQVMGIIQSLMSGLTKLLSSRGHLISATAGSSIGVNLLTGEQYLSILLPGQTFEPFYDKADVDRKYLSRTLEDAGTLVNPLIPWGVSGAFFAETLGVAVLSYLPFALFLWLSPIFTIVLGYWNDFKLRKA
ncbi:Na+/H+ antiporter NhaC [Alkalihalobacillus macyae]|uniref:Na+/H+ antiporter NhaC n=1 Tax=Guptibacillus hwajinpoensis TaxID=208199 RepID=UPI00273C5500|nr:Na+/H+ antiporter NhaC [Alkalihalobacillus macyae]MDP4550256.1 Na+/H+ antiporter NhaC [Alkalihalobacillus macyae]